MASAANCVAHRAQEQQDSPDHGQDDPDGPQDGDLGHETHDEEYDSKDNHTDGTLAALAAAPHADAVFVAHTGLDDMVSVRTLWRGIPLPRTVRATWWRITAEDVPPAPEQQADWLRAQWARIDSWIDDQR